MFRIDAPTAARNLPDPGAAGKPGYFRDGDPRTGAPATMPDADWLNMIQEELAELCIHYGLTLDKADRTQVRQAVQAAVAAQGPGKTPGPLRRRLLLNSLLDAMAGGAALRVLDAIADPFADAGRIDAGASCNYTHDATNSLIENSLNYAVLAGAGISSGDQPGTTPADGLDENNATHWESSQTGAAVPGGAYLGESYGANKVVRKLSVYNGRPGIVGWGVASGKAQRYSGGAWNDVAAITLADDASASEQVFEIPDNSGGTDWRLLANSTVTSGGGMWITDMTFSESAGANNMTLVSAAFRAFAEPAAGYLLGVVEPVDAVAYGEDVLADLSKDDGKTWEAAALAKIGVTEDGHDVVFGEVRFAAAAGRAVRSRWRTRNGKHVKLHGAVLDAEG